MKYKIKKFTFPSMKKKEEFDKNINDGSYVFQYSTKHADGTIDAYYEYNKKIDTVHQNNFPNEKQLNLF